MFSPINPKDVGVHEIQLLITEINSPTVINRFKLSIIGIKKPVENKIKISNANSTIIK